METVTLTRIFGDGTIATKNISKHQYEKNRKTFDAQGWTRDEIGGHFPVPVEVLKVERPAPVAVKVEPALPEPEVIMPDLGDEDEKPTETKIEVKPKQARTRRTAPKRKGK